MILVDLLVIIVGSANVLWLPANRKPPAVVFLAALAGLLLTSNLLPDPGLRAGGKGIAIAIYMVVLIGFPHWLAGIAREEADFDTRLQSILEPVLKAQNAWGRAHRKHGGSEAVVAQSGAKRACEAALGELDRVVPPSAEWARTVDLLRAYLLAARDRAAWRGSGDGQDPEPLSDEAIQSMIRELDAARDRGLRVR